MFQKTRVLETGLFNFDQMTVTVVRETLKKLHPRVISYRS